MSSRNMISIDTGAGFLRSKDSDLTTLKDLYSWIPTKVSCRNLSSGECFEYNTVTHKKKILKASKASEKSEDIILIDTGAGFIRCAVSELPLLKTNYPWISDIVSCQNTTTSKQFKYNAVTQKALSTVDEQQLDRQVKEIDENSNDYLKIQIFNLEKENKKLTSLVNSLRVERDALRKELDRTSSKASFSLFGSHDDFYEFG